MGRKRKKAELKPFCFFCDRAFADEGTLIAHQKTVHFKCSECRKRLTGLQALMQHSVGVHKVETTTIPGARADRDTTEYNILGMAGVPQFLLDQKVAAARAEKRAKAEAEGKPADSDDDEEEEAAAAAAAAPAAPATQAPPPPPPAAAAYPAMSPGYGYAGGYAPGPYGANPYAPSPYAPRPPHMLGPGGVAAPLMFQMGRAPPPAMPFYAQPQLLQMHMQPIMQMQPYGHAHAPLLGQLPTPPPPPAHLTMQLPPPPPARPTGAGEASAPASSAATAAAAAAAAGTNLTAEGGEPVQFVFEEGPDGLSMEEKRAQLAKYRSKAKQ